MKRKVISVIMAGIILCTVTTPVFAEPTQEVLESQAKLGEYDKIIEKKNAEIAKLNSEVEPHLEIVKKNNEEVKKIEGEIEELNKEIDKSKGELKSKQDVLSKRVRELYKSGGATSYLSVISNAEGIDDFLERLDTTTRIISIDKKAVDEIVTEQDKVNKKVEVLEKKKSETKKKNLESERSIKAVEKKKDEQQKLIDEKLEERAKISEEDLAPKELATISGQISIIDNSTSSSEISAAVTALKSMIEYKEIISQTAINAATESIKKGESILAEMEKQSVSANSGAGVVEAAYLYLGVPYVWGGTTPDGFDCSGFTSYVYRNHVGIEITRTTYSQMAQGVAVSYDNLMPGDLVFTYGGDHVGIYVGGGSYIHAPQPGDVVRVSPVQGFYCARRVL